MAEDRTYFRVHDGVDEHPKIAPLSDAAFRLLIETWAYCSRNRNDGRLTDAVWRKRGRPKTRRELEDAGLVEQHDGFVQVHDYLDWQRSAAEIDEIRAGRGAGGAYGNHIRWHVKRRINDPACEHCNPPDQPLPSPDDSSQDRSQNRSDDRSQTDRSPIANGSHRQRQRERPVVTREGGATDPNASDSPPRPPTYPDHCRRHAHIAIPGPCGDCADQRKANRAAPPRRLTVVPDPARHPCLVHAEPDVHHCRGCAADRKAAQ